MALSDMISFTRYPWSIISIVFVINAVISIFIYPVIEFNILYSIDPTDPTDNNNIFRIMNFMNFIVGMQIIIKLIIHRYNICDVNTEIMKEIRKGIGFICMIGTIMPIISTIFLSLPFFSSEYIYYIILRIIVTVVSIICTIIAMILNKYYS